ncbi:MAG: transpeptidase family protein [Bacteroidota bacterium]|nr:transpeptidase family protein [Bacteroidota bacterium]
MDVKKDILWRVYLCFIGIIMLGAVVLGRAIYIQRVQGDYWKKMANTQHLKYMDVNAERGTIYSEDGNMLSTSIPVFDVYVDFGADGLTEKNGKRFYDNLDSLSISLAGLFKDASVASYRKLLVTAYKNQDRYYALKKKISFEEYIALRNFPLVKQGRNKSGFIIDVKDNRVNPYVLLGNRTIGLSRGDTSKNVGLERSYDSVLKGQTGSRLMRYMAGAYVPVDGAEIEPENGKDIITTIDTYMQDVAENALMKMMVANNSLHGTCIVMETKTGKIKAIANLGRRPDGDYIEDYNYGLGRRTEPGSVFKLATLIALLEDKYVDTSSMVDCEGGIKSFYGLRIKDSHLGVGLLTVKEAFARSSNVAFAKMADEYYHNQPTKFYEHLHHLRLDISTGIDIVGAAKPYIKKPTSKYWTKTTIPFMAHGYEELLTPLQLLMLYNAVANNGKMMQPYLVNSINEMGVEIKTFTPKVLVEKICSDETLGKLKDCLLAVVESEHGTGHALENDVYRFAGKTGTAVTAMDNRGYNKGAKIYQSAFMGYFPAQDPQYTIAVVIQNGSESKLAYGGVVSGPVFKEVADKIYAEKIGSQSLDKIHVGVDSGVSRFYGLKIDLDKILNMFSYSSTDSATAGSWRSTTLLNKQANLNTAYDSGATVNRVPDVTGLGLKDALYLLENMGLKVEAKGKGKVTYQSIAQNTGFHKGQSINLQLN